MRASRARFGPCGVNSNEVALLLLLRTAPGSPLSLARRLEHLSRPVLSTMKFDTEKKRGKASKGKAWRVIDVATGEVVRVNGVLQDGLDLDDADDLADALNYIEATRPPLNH